MNQQRKKRTSGLDCIAFIGRLDSAKCGDPRQDAEAVRIFLVALDYMSCRGRVQQSIGCDTIASVCNGSLMDVASAFAMKCAI